jgi:hypothetical protein
VSYGTVISLSHRLAWPHLKTLGELVDFARDVPADEIMPRVTQQLHEIVRLQKNPRAAARRCCDRPSLLVC